MAIFPAAGIAGLLGQASPYGAPLRQAAPTADQAVNQVQLRPRLPIASQGPIGMDGQPIFPLLQPSIVNTGNQRVVPASVESGGVPQDMINSFAAMSPENAASLAQARLQQRDVKPPAVQKFLTEVSGGNYDFSLPTPNIVDNYQGPLGAQVLAANPNGLPNMTNTGGNPSDFLGIKATPRPSAGTFNADALMSALPTVGGPMGSPLSSVEPDYTGFARPPAPSMNVPLAYDSFPVNRPSFNDFPVGITGGGGLRPPPGGLFGFPGFPPPPSDPPSNYPGYGGGGSTGGGGGLMAEIPKAIEPVIQNASKSLNTGIGQIISKTMGTGGGSGPDYRVQDIVRPQNMQNLLLGGMF